MMGGPEVGVGAALLAGLASALSPCVFPIVPGCVAWAAGLALEERRRADRGAALQGAGAYAALFVLGFAVTFVMMGATAAPLGGAVLDSLVEIQRTGGVVLVAAGLLLALRTGRSAAGGRVGRLRGVAGVASVVAGAGFAAAWTPCIGPVLATALFHASDPGTLGRGVLLLSAYAAGLGSAFLVVAVAVSWAVAGSRRAGRWAMPAARSTGVALVILGALLLTGRIAALAAALAPFQGLVPLGY